MQDKRDEFRELLARAEKEKQELEQRRDAATQKKMEAKNRRCAEWIRQGLPCAEKIFAWARDFKDSSLGQRLLEFTERDGKGKKSFLFFSVKGERFHVPNLCIPEFGIVCYCGWDYRGKHIEHLAADSPRTLAKWCPPNLLKICWKSIENGMVYEELKEQLKHRLMVLRSEANRAEKESITPE